MFTLALVVAVVLAQQGPGSGPWEIRTPLSQGLNETELIAAEERVNDQIDGRVCYVVIKNGYLVFEHYRNRWTEESMRAGWSTTKSHCSSLFAIATQQGWANASDLVRNRNDDTRDCNEDAAFRNVLTMTGESRNIDNPQFSYDTDGTLCLDTLSDFIEENNPYRLSAEEFKDRFWQDVLGMENFDWTNYLGYLHCGYTSETSCRDLARAAQLWLNEGFWPGHGQVLNREHILEGRTAVYPDSGADYGFTVWLESNDPIDPQVHSFNGAYSQCAYISKRHEAIVVSMGNGDVSGARCGFAWTESREAIVSQDLRHTIPANIPPVDETKFPGIPHQEILLVRDYAVHHPEKLSKEELQKLNQYLIEWGEQPILQ